MKYPKPIMRLSELEGMGFPKEHLKFAYRTPGQTFASKINPFKDNSPIIFDTVGFESWRQKIIRVQQKRGRINLD